MIAPFRGSVDANTTMLRILPVCGATGVEKAKDCAALLIVTLAESRNILCKALRSWAQHWDKARDRSPS